MSLQRVGVLGATSLVGRHLLPLLVPHSQDVLAFSRVLRKPESFVGARWLRPDMTDGDTIRILHWICLAPIWVLPDYFALLQSSGATKVIVLSSNSRFSKQHSSSDAERALAARLADAEQRVQTWAEQNCVQWVILRPTMIYGGGLDRNVTDIARFVRRWRVFPLIGNGRGLRQPVHADDVAALCVGALLNAETRNLALDVCGGETLTYREMVRRIGLGVGVSVRFVPAPRSVMRLGVWAMSLLPRFRSLSPALVDRMKEDLVADGSIAEALLGIRPRPFAPTAQDLPFSNKSG